MKRSIVILSIFVTALLIKAEVRLPAILGSHMVMQQNSETKLWGWCSPGEAIKVTVDWDTTVYKTTGTGYAKWSITLKTPKAGGPYSIVINGSNKIVLDDVLIGEVWLCSGQSNMEWSGTQNLKQSLDEAPNATNTSIRFFYITKSTAAYPQDNCEGSWKVCSPAEMKKFSAVGYFFGKKLQQELKVPVGLINSNWGGTPAEVWTPSDAVLNNTTLKAAADKINPTPWWPKESGALYNAMIYPITQHTIAGAIWYQGESNTKTYASYQQLFTTMIGEWRKSWKKDFPFYYVQIAPYTYDNKNIGALLREAQTKSMSYPNTGMVVVSDLVADVKNIHPTNKIDVAGRLANYALAETYGTYKGSYKSPTYQTMSINKNVVHIGFANAEKGLVSRNGAPTEFYIAGEDRVFYPATVKIQGSSVSLWAKEVKTPVAVRFGFSNTAIPNLFSTEGLPVNIFRTDNWDLEQ